MAPPPKPGPVALRAVALMRMAAANDSGDNLAPISYRLPIRLPDSAVPTTFTVHLAPDDRVSFLVTCGELPEIRTCGGDERDALAMAEEAIREALDARRSSLDLSY